MLNKDPSLIQQSVINPIQIFQQYHKSQGINNKSFNKKNKKEKKEKKVFKEEISESVQKKVKKLKIKNNKK